MANPDHTTTPDRRLIDDAGVLLMDLFSIARDDRQAADLRLLAQDALAALEPFFDLLVQRYCNVQRR